MTRFVVKRVGGRIDVLDVPVGHRSLDRVRAWLEKAGARPQTCIFFEDVALKDGSTLSDTVASVVEGLQGEGGETSGISQDESDAPLPGVAHDRRGAGGSSSKRDSLQRPVWRIVGGDQTDGIAVREGESLKSGPLGGRLQPGSQVEEVELSGNRLRYLLLSGDGPAEGWITTQIPGKELATKGVGFLRHRVVPRSLPLALLFGPEGCQRKPMLAPSLLFIPAVRMMFSQAADVLGYNLLERCQYFPEWMLARTRYCQPALFVSSLAALCKLRADKPQVVERAGAVAGIGVGYYAALCAAGVLTFEDALRLVEVRAQAMEEAQVLGDFLEAVVSGIDAERLQQLCDEVDGPCFINHYIWPKCFDVAGPARSMFILKDLAEKAGAVAVRINNTAVASETCLMRPALRRLEAALEEVAPNMQPPCCTVWTTTTPRAFKPGSSVSEIVADLKTHLTAPSLIEQTIRGLTSAGFKEFYDVGSRGFIRTMLHRTDKHLRRRTHLVDPWKHS